MTKPEDITGLLAKMQQGDSVAEDKLATLVYGELRAMAAREFRKERGYRTLQPTALVNEAFIKLLGEDLPTIQNRAHFFAIASRKMRTILIDYSRRNSAGKRGGDRQRVELDDNSPAPAVNADLILDLNAALEALAALDKRKAMIAEMRFFGGMTTEEVAEALGISVTTVVDEWGRAKAWLKRELEK